MGYNGTYDGIPMVISHLPMGFSRKRMNSLVVNSI